MRLYIFNREEGSLNNMLTTKTNPAYIAIPLVISRTVMFFVFVFTHTIPHLEFYNPDLVGQFPNVQCNSIHFLLSLDARVLINTNNEMMCIN